MIEDLGYCEHERGRDGKSKKIHATAEAAEEFERDCRAAWPGNLELIAYKCPYAEHFHLTGMRSADSYPRGFVKHERMEVAALTVDDEIVAATKRLQELQDKKISLARLAAERDAAKVAVSARMAHNGHLHQVMLFISAGSLSIWMSAAQGRELLEKLPAALAFQGMADAIVEE